MRSLLVAVVALATFAAASHADAIDLKSLKNKLLSSVGLDDGQAEQDESYQSGLSGLLQGSDGNSFNLDSISDKVKDKACDYVLDNASSLI